MELTEDEIIQKYARNCMHCTRNLLLPYEYELSCFVYGSDMIKRRNKLNKIWRNKMKFNNGLKYAEQKFFHFIIGI